MTKFMRCVGYLAAAGILSFIVGRILPKKWFNWEAPWFKSFAWEKNGKIYERVHIRRWKDLLPDMNKITPALMKGRAPKSAHGSAKELEGVLQETCVAEAIHLSLCVAGLGCIDLMPGAGGVLLAVLHALGNLLFVMVQRYNRPRMYKLYRRRAAVKPETKPMEKYEGETA